MKMEAEDGLGRLLISETGPTWVGEKNAILPLQWRRRTDQRPEASVPTPRVLTPCPLWFRQAKHSQTLRHAAPKACNKLRGWSLCGLPSALTAAYIRSNENTSEIVKWQDYPRLVTYKENKWNRHHGYSCWNWQGKLFSPSTSGKESLVFFQLGTFWSRDVTAKILKYKPNVSKWVYSLDFLKPSCERAVCFVLLLRKLCFYYIQLCQACFQERKSSNPMCCISSRPRSSREIQNWCNALKR